MSWIKRFFGFGGEAASQEPAVAPLTEKDVSSPHAGLAAVMLGQQHGSGSASQGWGRPSPDDVPVPMSVFRDYQIKTSKYIHDLRGQFQQVVRQNDALQRIVQDFGNRLDVLQRDHSALRQETHTGLSEVKRDVAMIAAKGDPVMRAQLSSAESALSLLSQPAGHDRRIDGPDLSKNKLISP